MRKQQKASDYSLTDHQARKLIDNTTSFRDRVILRLMLDAGLRRSEVAGLKREHIDTLQSQITVIGKGKRRIVPLKKEFMNQIKDFTFWSEKSPKRGYVFLSRKSPKKPITAKCINDIVSRAAIQARVKHPDSQRSHLNPHLLRHTFARRMKKSGLSYDALQQVLGHESFATTMNVYGKKSVADIKEEFEKIID